MKLQDAEDDALNQCARLLKFAAEHRKQSQLKDEIVAPITQSWELRETGKWDPAASKNFWMAYSALCDLVQPTTLDTIDTNAPTPGKLRWIFFGPPAQSSLSRQFARLCMAGLVLLLALAVILGYIASTAEALSTEMRNLRTEADKAATQIRGDIDGVNSDLERLMSDDKAKIPFDPQKSTLDQDLINLPLPADTASKVSQLREHLQALYYYSDTMYQKALAISSVTRVVSSVTGLPGVDDYYKGPLTPVPVLRDALGNLSDYYGNRRELNEILQKTWIYNAAYNAFVPMLLGALGACTYVLRLVSDEIKETTFSKTSPIRNVVRVALGALAGVVIGFGGIVTGTGLSSAALAFIAGYAVEPVFSTLDGIAERFREAKKSASSS